MTDRPTTGALRPHGIDPRELSDDDLVREVTHLHETRHDAMRGASESAFEAHTERMLALEREYLRRFPEDSPPDPVHPRRRPRERRPARSRSGPRPPRLICSRWKASTTSVRVGPPAAGMHAALMVSAG